MPTTLARSVLRAAALPVLLVLQAACTPQLAGPPSNAPGTGHVIGAQEIARGPARNAWELLEGRVPQLRFSDGTAGLEVGVRGRGPDAGPPVVVVDGVITHGIDQLRSIQTHEIRSIRVLSGIEASQRYGAFGSNGAVLIETRKE